MTLKNLFSGENGKKILMLGAAAVMILMLLSTVSCESKTVNQENTAAAEDASKIEVTLEERLVKLLEKIDGVGTVSVMVTLDRSSEKLYEKDEKTETNTKSDSGGGTENTARETAAVLAGSAKQPLQVGTVQPIVRGAAVVCSGASDPVIREKVTYAVAKALNIGISKVYVTY